MNKINLTLIILIIAMTTITTNANCQKNIEAIISPQGNTTFKITLDRYCLYLSTKGMIIGFGAQNNEEISYDLCGRIQRIGLAKISYDLQNNLAAVGNDELIYDLKGHLQKIGNLIIKYDVENRLSEIGRKIVTYDIHTGKLLSIGSSSISYNLNGTIRQIQDPEGQVSLVVHQGKFD
jgi:hypothetical protein